MWIFALFGRQSGGRRQDDGSIDYVDQKGVHWRITGIAPDFWCVSTEGYGGRWSEARGGVCGSVSKDQAIENIEGNAAGRDPSTGEIIVDIPT